LALANIASVSDVRCAISDIEPDLLLVNPSHATTRGLGRRRGTWAVARIRSIRLYDQLRHRIRWRQSPERAVIARLTKNSANKAPPRVEIDRSIRIHD
jgi:hypothetical protein